MWRCPVCRGNIRIFEAVASVILYEDGCEQDSGFEWDDDNEAECTSCNWRGTVASAVEEEIE
jgi:hypothetical protein